MPAFLPSILSATADWSKIILPIIISLLLTFLLWRWVQKPTETIDAMQDDARADISSRLNGAAKSRKEMHQDIAQNRSELRLIRSEVDLIKGREFVTGHEHRALERRVDSLEEAYNAINAKLSGINGKMEILVDHLIPKGA